MTKPEVKTVATARRMSLTKWNRVKAFSRDLFNEIDKSCGFCELGKSRAREGELRFIAKCEHCGVDEVCDAILKKSETMEGSITQLIEETIEFLETMDVTEK